MPFTEADEEIAQEAFYVCPGAAIVVDTADVSVIDLAGGH